jgi:hypothetical protein
MFVCKFAHIRSVTIKGGFSSMARGKHFNHKERGHEPTIPKHGQQVVEKKIEHLGYAIEPVASENQAPVTVKVEK